METSYRDIARAILGPETGLWQPAPFALIEVQGPDTVDYLQRLCSQDVAGMADGEARPAAFLDAKGKLLHTCALARQGDLVVLLTRDDRHQALAELLERYHFTEKLEIQPRDGACGLVVAPDETPLPLPPGQCQGLGGGIALNLPSYSGLQLLFVFGAPATVSEFLATVPVRAVAAEEAACLRILAGLVHAGEDTEDRTLAMEAPIEDHISTTKGCYTGQEIVARIHTYGKVNRRLAPLLIDGAAAIEPGTALVERDEGDPVGRVMASAALPGQDRSVGFGFVPRDFAEVGTVIDLAELGGRSVQVVSFGPASSSTT